MGSSASVAERGGNLTRFLSDLTAKVMGRSNDKPRTNTASKIVMQNGECFGVLHAHKLTGYKAPNAYGHSPAFPKGTSYKDAFKASQSPQTQASPAESGRLANKDLSPYDPNALRSRLPVDFGDQSKPAVRFCKPRNVSNFEITDPNLGHTDANRFKTSNKTFHARLDPGQGSANAGIMAEKARRLHSKIWD